MVSAAGHIPLIKLNWVSRGMAVHISYGVAHIIYVKEEKYVWMHPSKPVTGSDRGEGSSPLRSLIRDP